MTTTMAANLRSQCRLAALVYACVLLQVIAVCSAQRRNGNALSVTTRSVPTSAQMNQSDCLTAHSLCLSELTCKISFESLDRHCGSGAESVTCNAPKLSHCQSVLKTLENRSPFRNCLCERKFDPSTTEYESCQFYRQLVLQHPCSSTRAAGPAVRTDETRTTTVPSTTRRTTRPRVTSTTRRVAAKSGLTTKSATNVAGNCSAPEYVDCAFARKHCANDKQCSASLDAFKRQCRGKSECTGDVTGCERVATELRKRSALFTCQCSTARYRKDTDSAETERGERCESVRDRFQTHPCLSNTPQQAACAPSLDQPPQVTWNSAQTKTQTVAETETETETETDRDCFSVVTRCDSDVLCRSELAKLISACKFMRAARTMRSSNTAVNNGRKRKNRGAPGASERCNTTACQQAAVEFYSTVRSSLAKQAAFCSCDKLQPDYANCVKHVDYFRPPCLFQQGAESASASASASGSLAPPSCFTLINECFENRTPEPATAKASQSLSQSQRLATRNASDNCQQRWRHFQQECRATTTNADPQSSSDSDSDTNRCVRGVPNCRTAMMKLIGLPLFTGYCSCDGIVDAKLKNMCESVQEYLFNNECVRQAVTADARPKHARTADAQGGIASLVPDRNGGMLRATLSTGYGGVAQERYPRDFCSQVQRYNRLSKKHRIYMYVNGSECSELCDCSTNEDTYACRNLTCEARPDAQPQPQPDAATASVSTLQNRRPCGGNGREPRSGVVLSDEGQHCVCQNGELVCALSTATLQQHVGTTTLAPNSSVDNNGLFLHVGYSVNEQKMLESNQIRIDFESLVRKLTQLLNGETGIRACDLQVRTATDGNIVFEVKITGKSDSIANASADADGRTSGGNGNGNATADLSHQVCYYPAQLLSHFINLRHPAVSHDAELSMFRSAALHSPRYSIRNAHDRLSDDEDSLVPVEDDSNELEPPFDVQAQAQARPFNDQSFNARRTPKSNDLFDNVLPRPHAQMRGHLANAADYHRPLTGRPALLCFFYLFYQHWIIA